MFEEMTGTDSVTLGGVLVGVVIISVHAVKWWRTDKGHEWQALVLPFAPLMAYGMLLILSAGGILGGSAGVTLWGGNRVGKVALEEGVGGSDTDATRASNIVLEDGGHAVVIVMTAVWIAWMVFSPDSRAAGIKGAGIVRKIFMVARHNLPLILPVIAGVCLGLSGGLAGLAAQGLAPAVDTLGALLWGLFD